MGFEYPAYPRIWYRPGTEFLSFRADAKFGLHHYNSIARQKGMQSRE